MGTLAIEKFGLPLELMMENAGLHLARLAAMHNTKDQDILIGIGTGNSGGGGLVAARRLAGWGYRVFLDIPDEKLKALPAIQLKRALAFGVKTEKTSNPDVFVDAYLGFSQRLPLSPEFEDATNNSNRLNCLKISLDLPTGFDPETGTSLFVPDMILTLAALKNELLKPGVKAEIFLADIGIPSKIYEEFNLPQPDFQKSGIVRIFKMLL
jgi:NAD(P)H-hydrate epimerase